MKTLGLVTAAIGFVLCPPCLGFPAPQFVEDLVNLRFQLDARVFAVMACVHAIGFDLDSDAVIPGAVRKKVRDHLAAINPVLRERIRKFCESRDREQNSVQRQIKYVAYAMMLSGPPAFKLAHKPSQLPGEIREMVGLEALAEELWRTGDLGRLWDEVRPDYLREIEDYRSRIREVIVATLQYLRTEPRVSLDRQVILIPDLLNAPGVVNAFNIESNYLVVTGPSRSGQKPIKSIRHEYLHFLLDPLLTKYVGHLPEETPFLKRAAEQPGALERYRQNFHLMVTESLLQMVELRMDHIPAERQGTLLLEAYDQGLILAPYFEEFLRKFERQTVSMPEIFQSMLDGIRWDLESKRDEAISKMRLEALSRQAREKAEEAARTESAEEASARLNKANKLLVGREFERAREVLEAILQGDPENASALFGLAQVELQRESFERALELYEKAAASAKQEAWIAGWSYVHRGNIYRVQDEPEKANAEWSRVLKLQGDLRGAADAARKALQSTP